MRDQMRDQMLRLPLEWKQDEQGMRRSIRCRKKQKSDMARFVIKLSDTSKNGAPYPIGLHTRLHL